jgi:hypothetical protein
MVNALPSGIHERTSLFASSSKTAMRCSAKLCFLYPSMTRSSLVPLMISAMGSAGASTFFSCPVALEVFTCIALGDLGVLASRSDAAASTKAMKGFSLLSSEAWEDGESTRSLEGMVAAIAWGASSMFIVESGKH